MAKNYIKALEISDVDAATLSAIPIAINTTPFEHPCLIIRIINDSNKGVFISYDDDSLEHDYIPANSVLQLPFQANAQPNNFCALMKKGTIVYASIIGMAGTGSIYLTGYYQD